MSPTTLFVPVLILVAAVAGRWALRRNPTVSKQQIFAASAATLGGILSASSSTTGAVWFYTSSTIATFTGSFLLMALLHRWDPPHTSGSA